MNGADVEGGGIYPMPNVSVAFGLRRRVIDR